MGNKGGVPSWCSRLHFLSHTVSSLSSHITGKMLGTTPILALSSALFVLSTAQAGAGTAYPGEELLIRDPGVYGPALEVVHLYWDQFPTGIAVSKNGRRFSNYPGGLDSNNTYRGTVPKYTIAELMPNNTERAFPSVEMNSPVSRFSGECWFEQLADVCYSMSYLCLSSLNYHTGQKRQVDQVLRI
jgi:hypothetical protein